MFKEMYTFVNLHLFNSANKWETERIHDANILIRSKI